jgi:hypothetical protein
MDHDGVQPEIMAGIEYHLRSDAWIDTRLSTVEVQTPWHGNRRVQSFAKKSIR